jgi:hypothetical protein
MADFFDIVNAPVKAIAGAVAPETRRMPRQTVLGVGEIGGDPGRVEDEYQRRVREQLAGRQREQEAALFEQQRGRILGAMQPSTVATEAAREQAREAGQATLGAARSQMGVAGTQTAALGALGAGQAQQFGMAEARQVQAQEEQRNALAQAQLAEMLRQQELARMGLERGDVAQALGAQRALMIPELEMQQQYAAAEAERARRRQAATVSGIASLGAAGYDAYASYQQQQAQDQQAREAYNAMTEEERRRRFG